MVQLLLRGWGTGRCVSTPQLHRAHAEWQPYPQLWASSGAQGCKRHRPSAAWAAPCMADGRSPCTGLLAGWPAQSSPVVSMGGFRICECGMHVFLFWEGVVLGKREAEAMYHTGTRAVTQQKTFQHGWVLHARALTSNDRADGTGAAGTCAVAASGLGCRLPDAGRCCDMLAALLHAAQCAGQHACGQHAEDLQRV